MTKLLPPGSVSWMQARAAGQPADLFTVTVVHKRDHAFKRKPDGRIKCALCEQPKAWFGHAGYPPSINIAGSTANPHVYQQIKRTWEDIMSILLDEAGLPRGLGGVYAEGTIGFPTRSRRDQGNFRGYLEKALGDALVTGGWLEDDDWTRYEFGNLRAEHDPGAAWTRVTLVPRW